MLDSLLLHAVDQSDQMQIPFVATAEHPSLPPIYRAPCLGEVCIFETSISLLSREITTEVSMAEEMLDKASTNVRILGEGHEQHYLHHPPSHAVDGRHETCFRSPTSTCVCP